MGMLLLDDLIQAVRNEHLVEEIYREGNEVILTAAGERFSIAGPAACEFLQSILQVASHHPAPGGRFRKGV
jgi:DNA-binding transcriptional LysR family regulator